MNEKGSDGREHPRALVERYLALTSDAEVAQKSVRRSTETLRFLDQQIDEIRGKLNKAVGRSVRQRAFEFSGRVVLVNWNETIPATITVIDLE